MQGRDPERANGRGAAGLAVHGRPHLGVDGEGEGPGTATVRGHVGLLHTPALQADLQ